MPSSIMTIMIIVVVLALVFDFINGFHDTANAIATSVATRVLSMRQAVIMCAVLNFIGAFMSVAVAKTIGADMIKSNGITQTVIIAALIGAIMWNLITWYYGIPSSSSHALIGGLLGAAVIATGSFTVVHWGNFLVKVVLWLFLSPVIGFIVGYLIMNIMNVLLKKTRPATVTRVF